MSERRTSKQLDANHSSQECMGDNPYWIPKFRFDEVCKQLKKEKELSRSLKNEIVQCDDVIQQLRQDKLDATVKIVNLLNQY